MSCFLVTLKLKHIFFKQPKFKYNLAKVYRQRFSQTIFYETCLSTLRYITSNQKDEFSDSESDDESDNIKRKSTINVSHYEDANINFNQQTVSAQNHNNEFPSLPHSMQSLTISQKQQLLKSLIQQSFMFLDLSDMLQSEDLQIYESMIKQQIFTGEQSILQPTKYNNVNLNQRLRFFDSEALRLLKSYIEFCKRVLEELKIEDQSTQNKTFLQRLILQLKATLLTSFPQSQLISYSLLKRFIKHFNIMIQILIKTITIKYNITASEDQFVDNFFTKQNIKSLILFIVFEDEVFLKAVFQRFYNGINSGVVKMVEGLKIDNDEFLEELKNAYFHGKQPQKQKPLNHLLSHKSNLQKILQKKNKFPFFKRSLRTLQTITSPKQPMKVLKIIYEINKTISREHTEFVIATVDLNDEITRKSIGVVNVKQSKPQKDETNVLSFLQPQNNRFSMYITQNQRQLSVSNDYNMNSINSKLMKKYSFSREIQCLIIKWLLSTKIDKLKFIVTNCLMAYFFVNQNDLKDKKGSALMPFIEIIQQFIQNDQANSRKLP